MATRQFNLTAAAQQELQCAYDACRNGAERTRLQAVRLYGSGWSVADIIEITGCTRRSLARWCATYQREGCAGLTDHRTGGNRALLTAEQQVVIADKLRQYTPYDIFGPDHQSGGAGEYWSVPDLRRAVQKWTGVVYQHAQSYRDLFAACGFSYQRTEKQYRSRNAAAVAEFCDQLEKN